MEIQSGNRGTSPNEKGLAKLRTLFPWGKPFILLRHSCFVILFCVILQTSVECAYHYIHIIYIYTVYYTITYTYRQPYPVVADSISFPKTVPMAVWGLQALAEGLPSSSHLGSNFGQAWAGCAQDLTISDLLRMIFHVSFLQAPRVGWCLESSSHWIIV